jgi:methionyl-tRNA formyltransferase
MKMVFIGASGFGLRCLKKVLTLPCCQVTGIVTNPANFVISYRPEGVINVLHVDFRPFAEEHGIPVHVMLGGMNSPELAETIKEWAPDFILVVGWYHMIPKVIRALAPTAGLHASLLPDYSGGAPLVWAIINGEEKAGISFFMMAEGVDNGDLIGQKAVPIRLNDNIRTLYAQIEQAGLELLAENLPKIAQNQCQPTPQDERKRRIMPQRRPEDGLIDWQWSAWQLYNFIRAQTRPYPGAFAFFKGHKVTIWEAKLFDYLPPDYSQRPAKAGAILGMVNQGPLQGILVATGNGDHPLLITSVSLENGATVSGLEGAALMNLKPGEVFASSK